jgi:hypothetical protein
MDAEGLAVLEKYPVMESNCTSEELVSSTAASSALRTMPEVVSVFGRLLRASIVVAWHQAAEEGPHSSITIVFVVNFMP